MSRRLFLRMRIIVILDLCMFSGSTICFILCLKNCVGFQALIQYQTRASAVTARTSLQVVFHLHGNGALLGLLILIIFME